MLNQLNSTLRMKANELMIGDLVHCITDNTTHRILRLNTKCDMPFMEGSEWYADEKDRANVLSDVEPIPLSTEILEANGWRSIGGQFDDWYDNDEAPFFVEISQESTSLSVNLLTCRYVHELQHALRLVGMIQSADNLIIEKQTDDKGNKEAS